MQPVDRRHAGRPRPLRAIGLVLVWIGATMLLFVAHQVWGTAFSASRAQTRLASDFARLVESAEPLAPPSSGVPATTTTTTITTAVIDTTAVPTEQAVRAVAAARPGDVVGRITAPRIGLDRYIVEGTGTDELRAGPGHYIGTSPLGTSGNSAIAGHRTTYGAPFADIDRLQPGDLVTVETPIGSATYEVVDPALAFGDRLSDVVEVRTGSVVVTPEDSFVLAASEDDRLTLTACHPKYSTRQRIVVVARLLTPPLGMEPLAPAPETSVLSPTITSDTSPSESGTIDATADAVSSPSLSDVTVADLSDAFDGRPALGPTILFALLTMLVAVGTTACARRLGAGLAALLGVVPLATCLWGLFEHIDLLFPVY